MSHDTEMLVHDGPVYEPDPVLTEEDDIFARDTNLKSLVDSRWRPDRVAPSERDGHRWQWRHGLKDAPRFLQVFFSPTPGGAPAYPVVWSWEYNHSGNPVTVSLDSEYVYLEIYDHKPLHGVWKADGGWTQHTKGYWRIIAVE